MTERHDQQRDINTLLLAAQVAQRRFPRRTRLVKDLEAAASELWGMPTTVEDYFLTTDAARERHQARIAEIRGEARHA